MLVEWQRKELLQAMHVDAAHNPGPDGRKDPQLATEQKTMDREARIVELKADIASKESALKNYMANSSSSRWYWPYRHKIDALILELKQLEVGD